MKKTLVILPVILLLCVIALWSAIVAQSRGVSIFSLSALNGEEAEQADDDGDSPFIAPSPGDYDSKDTAIVSRVDSEKGLITLLNKIVNRYYTLSYDGLTAFADRYGTSISASQLKPGSIVDICFRRGNKYLVNACVSPVSWVREVNSGFVIDENKRELSLGKDKFSLPNRMVLLSENEDIELRDLNINDTLSVSGIDDTVYSITVDKGHGYLRLAGDEYFVGGFIEVGQRIFTRITGDMLLTVPEGTYRVYLRNGRHGGSKEATIYKDEETLLDVSDLQGEEIKVGRVFFTLNPNTASVYIDGDKVDTGSAVELEYGIHSMIVTADGYETITQYLRVGQENANLNVSMERSSSDVRDDSTDNPGIETPSYTPGDGLITDENGNIIINEPDGSPEENALYNSLPLMPSEGTGQLGNTGQIAGTGQNNNAPGQGNAATGQTSNPYIQNYGNQGNQTNQATAGQQNQYTTQPNQNPPQPGQPANDNNTITATDEGSYLVKISQPEGAEVYIDGSYVGIVPTSFKKKPGSRVVSLRKSGYQTRSYTIQVDNDSTNMQLSFSELERDAAYTGSTALTDTLINTLAGSVLNNSSSNLANLTGSGLR